MDLNNQLIVIILAFSRIASFVFFLPFLKSKSVPSISKITVSLALSFSVMGSFEKVSVTTMYELTGLIFVQVLIGVSLAFLVHMMMSGVQMAGALLDMDMGFANARIFDPGTNQASTPLSNIMFYVFILIFISCGGITNLVSGIIYSFKFATPDYFLGDPNVMQLFLDVFTFMLVTAVQIAIPLMASNFLVNIILLILGKMAPQMNIFLNMFAIKIAFGLFLLVVTLPFFGDLFVQLNEVIMERLIDSIHTIFN